MSDDGTHTAVSGFVSYLRDTPAKVGVTYRARTELETGLRCEVRSGKKGKHAVVIDEPPGVGGTDEGPNPMEAVLVGLASCQAITYRVWAGQLGIRLDHVAVEVEGDVDLRGFFGIEEGVRSGFGAVRVRVALEGPEGDERYRELAEAVDRHCPVLDMLASPAPIERILVEAAELATGS